LRIELEYRTKGCFELPLLDYFPRLSPYSMREIILEGIPLHPRITINGAEEGIWIEEAQDCEDPVFLNRDEAVCGAAAGISHERNGVALIKKGSRLFELRTGDGLKLTGKDAVFSKVPGVLVVALSDPPHTHIVTAGSWGATIFEKAYRGIPRKASVGFRSFSVIYEEGRSQLIRDRTLEEAGFPAEAVALIDNSFLAWSSGWLLWINEEIPKPKAFAGSEKPEFAGFFMNLPVLSINSKLYRLEEGALIQLEKIGEVKGSATASDVAVIDEGNFVKAYDISFKPILSLPKDSSSSCWAADGKVFCCSRGICCFIEAGKSRASLEPQPGKEHTLRIEAEGIPLTVEHRGAVKRITAGESTMLKEERATVLEPFSFEVQIFHPLGRIETSISSPPRNAEIEAELQVFKAPVPHECGGSAFGVIKVKRAKAPEGVELLVLGRELKEGKELEVCLEKIPEKLEVVALDTARNYAKTATILTPSIIEIDPPKVEVKIVHGERSSTIELSSDADRMLASLVCSNRKIDLSSGRREVRGCAVPAHLLITAVKKGFAFRYRKNIALSGLLDFAERAVRKEGKEIYREGGFYAEIAPPPFPELNPIESFSLKVENDVEIAFESAQPAKGIILSSGGEDFMKPFPIIPGLNRLHVPLSNSYFLVMFDGIRTRSYRIDVPLELQLKSAFLQAELLSRVLRRESLDPATEDPGAL